MALPSPHKLLHNYICTYIGKAGLEVYTFVCMRYYAEPALHGRRNLLLNDIICPAIGARFPRYYNAHNEKNLTDLIQSDSTIAPSVVT